MPGLGKVPVTKRIRAAAACLMFAALAPGTASAAVAAATPDPGASTAPAPTPSPDVAPEVAPRAGVPELLPELLPDPNPHPSTAPETGGPPGHDRPPRPPSSSAPTTQERDALLARVTPYGIVPVVDTAGTPALTVDDQLVLTGGPQGVDAMRAAGIDVAPGPRPGVSAIRTGGRTVAWYIVEDPALADTPLPPVPAEDGGSGGAVPGLPRTGARATAVLAAAGLVLVLGGAAAVRFATLRRRARS